jgi:hypothetical protein
MAQGKGVGVRSLVHNISRVQGRVGASRWGLGRLTSNSIIHTNLHKLNNKLVSALLEHFWCTNKPRVNTQTHKTHHGPDLGEAITFLLIIYFMPGHRTSTQMSFCPRTPKLESRNSQNWDSCNVGNS